jgi:ribonuclease P protein component
MQRERRLRRRKDFAAAYRKGRVYGNHLLVLRVVDGGGDVARFGFVTGKAVGGAVVRNRVKRRLRAAADGLDAVPGVDIVVGARKTAASATYHALQRSLSTLMERAGAVRKPEPANRPQEIT